MTIVKCAYLQAAKHPIVVLEHKQTSQGALQLLRNPSM